MSMMNQLLLLIIKYWPNRQLIQDIHVNYGGESFSIVWEDISYFVDAPTMRVYELDAKLDYKFTFSAKTLTKILRANASRDFNRSFESDPLELVSM